MPLNLISFATVLCFILCFKKEKNKRRYVVVVCPWPIVYLIRPTLLSFPRTSCCVCLCAMREVNKPVFGIFLLLFSWLN